MEVGKE